MAAVLAVFLVALTTVGVSAQTHHVVGGWGPNLDVNSWLSGRVFTVGDKIWFKNSAREESIVEVGGVEEFVSCNLTNPIRMYSDPLNHVLLEKEGIRYFTSSNPEMCKNGLKLPIPVHPPPEYPGHISPPFDPSDDPSDPGHKSPPFDPSYDPPTPPFDPYPPVKPTPPTPPHEPPPIRPPPPHEPKPVQPPPSAAPAHFTVVLFVVSAGLLLCYYVSI